MRASHAPENAIIPRDDLARFVFESHMISDKQATAPDKSKDDKSNDDKKQQDENFLKLYKHIITAPIRTHATAIDDALKHIKVCDPAIGSGAFPVGMMNEIVRLRLLLNRCGLPQPYIRTAYDFKYHAIQESLYGVDIAVSAVDIAKLRLWLSLVVDENKPDEIYPLPNLDYKIMQGNALLGEKRQEDLFDSANVTEVRKLKNDFFTATSQKRKNLLQQKINALTNHSEDSLFDFYHDFAEIFHDGQSGFDIVIANPPYIQLQKHGGILGELYQDLNYQSFAKTGDIYQLFYEKAMQISKPNAHLCYITSNKWLRTDYGKKSRQLFIEQYNPKLLIDLGANIFETATVDTNILVMQNAKNQTMMQAVTVQHKDIALHQLVAKQAVTMENLTASAWVVLPAAELKLQQKIESIGKKLYLWDIIINYGIKTGFNNAFIIDNAAKQKLVEQDTKSAEILKPLLRGRDIKRWHEDWQGKWLIATLPALKLNIDDYPAIKNHLESFQPRINQTGEKGCRKKTTHQWFETQDAIAYHQDFEKEKIIYPNMTKYLPFIYDDKNYYTNDKSFILIGNHLKYLTAYFNSSVAQHWIKKHCPELQGGTRELRKTYFENIPIPPISNANQAIVTQLETLTDEIITHKQQNPTADIEIHEAEINHLVYQLYNLTPAEINIIEQSLEN
ncbi:MAG: Eco57I restriction-modification methylase domain-containing protein [Alphaproteobacteria bacterium]|nr:Eco57I restriction-modification methylase domain-containing protein [Alphaproteobacteria bacterium]